MEARKDESAYSNFERELARAERPDVVEWLSTLDPGPRILCDELGGANLTDVGRRLANAELFRTALVGYDLRTQRRVRPKEADPEILIITGWPRTGSTFLHELCCLDPTVACWTLSSAMSPTATAAEGESYARSWLKIADRLSPELRRVHPMSLAGPEECIAVLAFRFCSERFAIQFDLPSYAKWLASESMSDSYEWYAGVIADQFAGSQRLVLKAPAHLGHLDALRSSFPAARIVILQRPIREVLRSFVELVQAARSVYSDSIDPHQIEKEWSLRLKMAAEVPAWARAEGERVLYVQFDDLVRAPVATLERLYGWLNWPTEQIRKQVDPMIGSIASRHRVDRSR